MMLLFDAELYLYRAASAATVEVEWQADDWTIVCRHREARAIFQSAIADTCVALGSDRVALAFGDSTTFRHGLYASYKANRKGKAKPPGWLELVQWVLDVAQTRGWEILALPDVEADDVLGIYSGPERIICSQDKDLKTIPGALWRDGGGLTHSDKPAADRAFYSQVLTGDAADGYPGCPGVGPTKAGKILSGRWTEAEMWAAVLAAYKKAKRTEHDAVTQARLARILRPGEYDLAANAPILWQPPQI